MSERLSPADEEIIKSLAEFHDALEGSGMSELNRVLDVPFTFSANCVVGLTPTYASRCECWRCREQRGEPRDEELAAAVAIEARKAWNQWMGEFLNRKDGQP